MPPFAADDTPRPMGLLRRLIERGSRLLHRLIQRGSRLLRRLREKPAFWVVIFCNAALSGMWLIAPKYQHRQAMLERRYEVRRDSAIRQAAGQPLVEQSDAEADPHAQDRPLMVPLWRLTLLIGAIDVTAAAMVLWRWPRETDPQPVEPSSTRR